MDKQVFVDFLRSMPPFYGETTKGVLDEIQSVEGLRALLLTEFDRCLKEKDDKAVWFQYLSSMPGDSRNAKGEYRILEFYKRFPHVKMDFKRFNEALKVQNDDFKCALFLALPSTGDVGVLYKVGEVLTREKRVKNLLLLRASSKKKKYFLESIKIYERLRFDQQGKKEPPEKKSTPKLIEGPPVKNKSTRAHISGSRLQNRHTKRENSASRTPFCKECNALWDALTEKTLKHEYTIDHTVRSRFSDILACNHCHNLVCVKDRQQKVPLHANFITLGKDRFILAQYPSNDRLRLFLKGILDEEIEDIVDLTQDQDIQNLKRYYYFGEYENLRVKVLSNPRLKYGLKITNFEIEEKHAKKDVRHIRFEEWQNHKVISCKEFAHLIDSLEKLFSPKSKPPLVHCSAGVGRSALVIGGLHLKREIKRQNVESKEEAIQLLHETLWALRVQRGPMTVASYNQIHLLLRYTLSLICKG